MTSRLVTARELAEQLGVSAETVLRWTRRGELPAIRLPSGQLRFREDEIEARIEEWATTQRGSVTQPAGRRPEGKILGVTQPNSEEDR